MEKLDHLKRTLHPEEQLNVIDQCAIVAEALGEGSVFEGDKEGVALYLDISENQVYKMNFTHHNTLHEMKEYLRKTEYRPHTAYKFAVMPHGAQREFLDAEKTLDKGVYKFDTSEESIKNEE